ncbi:carbohydrate kinase [Salinarimonas ramus]|uniref:Carbohydrate kinase n=2 Tax=Salinarimonas ramus TaxID=690164 RepID=A0A917V385_9HYPH|nr:carbohydrate kinase [Salinarimonas ramus]
MILVCGEALIDLFVGADDGTALDARAVPGGSPFNVAIALARLGRSAGFCGGLSTDRFGDVLASRLARDGVDLALAPRLTASTTIGVVARRPNGDVSYAFHGHGAADRVITSADLPAALPEAVRALTFGSFSTAVDPAGAAYLALARREAGRRVISLDPNLRAMVTPDLAAWRERMGDFLALADIVKASAEDVADGFGVAHGDRAGEARLAESWLAGGARLVVVTHGPDGARAYLGGSGGTVVVEAPGRAVSVADTVGAGDTLHAGLLARLDERGLLDRDALARLDAGAVSDALAYAIAAASITCERAGANPPRAEEVEARLG